MFNVILMLVPLVLALALASAALYGAFGAAGRGTVDENRF